VAVLVGPQDAVVAKLELAHDCEAIATHYTARGVVPEIAAKRDEPHRRDARVHERLHQAELVDDELGPIQEFDVSIASEDQRLELLIRDLILKALQAGDVDRRVLRQA